MPGGLCVPAVARRYCCDVGGTAFCADLGPRRSPMLRGDEQQLARRQHAKRQAVGQCRVRLRPLHELPRKATSSDQSAAGPFLLVRASRPGEAPRSPRIFELHSSTKRKVDRRGKGGHSRATRPRTDQPLITVCSAPGPFSNVCWHHWRLESRVMRGLSASCGSPTGNYEERGSACRE